PQRFEGRIGVFGGTSLSTYLLLNILPGLDAGDSRHFVQTLLSSDKDYLTTRVSYKLNLRGPSVDLQAACSTSLVAIHFACQSLLAGECDMALAGGVSVMLPVKAGYRYQASGILSPDGRCRVFDAAAQGTVVG